MPPLLPKFHEMKAQFHSAEPQNCFPWLQELLHISLQLFFLHNLLLFLRLDLQWRLKLDNLTNFKYYANEFCLRKCLQIVVQVGPLAHFLFDTFSIAFAAALATLNCNLQVNKILATKSYLISQFLILRFQQHLMLHSTALWNYPCVRKASTNNNLTFKYFHFIV